MSKQSRRDLSPEERDEGFARPLRTRVRHIGVAAPTNQLLDLTPRQLAGHAARGRTGYVKFEPFLNGGGRHWTQAELDGVGRGCEATTTLGAALAELHAKRHVDETQANFIRCSGCKLTLPPGEFVWNDDDERVGS